MSNDTIATTMGTLTAFGFSLTAVGAGIYADSIGMALLVLGLEIIMCCGVVFYMECIRK